MASSSRTFLDTSVRWFQYYKTLAEKTFDQLNEDELHFRPNGESNSIEIIIKHMAGNMLSRWTNFMTEDGEKEWRQRDEEFEDRQLSKEELIETWNNGWNCLFAALQSIGEDDLMKTIYIRNQPLNVMDAIQRQLAHYPYHVGQILYIGKIIKSTEWKNLSMPKRR